VASNATLIPTDSYRYGVILPILDALNVPILLHHIKANYAVRTSPPPLAATLSRITRAESTTTNTVSNRPAVISREPKVRHGVNWRSGRPLEEVLTRRMIEFIVGLLELALYSNDTAPEIDLRLINRIHHRLELVEEPGLLEAEFLFSGAKVSH
jgi:hypothetical protein